jgi:hypothetical protein
MAFLEHAFVADEMPVSTNTGFEPIPAGWYEATIASADLKTTKAGTGQYIAVRYDITGPAHQGRVVFGNLNIRNPNPKAEEIGRQQLGELMRAIGLVKVSDTDELIGASIKIKVAIRTQEGYDPTNDVKGFANIGKMPANVTAPAPASAKAAPPWAK